MLLCIVHFVEDIAVPYQQFFDDTVDYWDAPRLGGISSYLRKEHKGMWNSFQSMH
jgi:hypothetical protein